MTWTLASGHDRRALDVVDGLGCCAEAGPHYSRRTPGAPSFTGVGQEIVLVTDCGRAVWAAVRNELPAPAFTGWRSRHGDLFRELKRREPGPPSKPGFLFRNMMFRNLGAGLSSDLIRSAVEETYRQWARRYGTVPPERLRTEVEVAKVKSANPGYCYLMAGWERGQIVRGKLHLWAPMREESRDRETGRRFDSGAEAEEREGPGQKTRRRGSAADGAGLAPALEDLPLA